VLWEGDQGPEQEVTVTATGESLLELSLDSQAALAQRLAEGVGGLYTLRVKGAADVAVPILVLSRTRVLGASTATPAGPSDAGASSRQFVAITVENLPRGGGLQYWCSYPASRAWYLPRRVSREATAPARIVEQRLVGRAPQLTRTTLECELPGDALVAQEAPEEQPPTIEGLVVVGARGEPAAMSVREPEALGFSVRLAERWTVTAVELRGAEVLVSASGLPGEPGRLACLSESSAGQRLSPATVLNATQLTCPIQAASGPVTFRLRDLAAGSDSRTFTLLPDARPALLGVAPEELFLPPRGTGELPELLARGEAFAPDCYCELDGEARLATRFLSSAELACALDSAPALSALGSPDGPAASWALAVRCPALGWVSQSVPVWPRHGPELVAASRSVVTEQAYLDGLRDLLLTGRRLTAGLTCVQRAASAPGVEHALPLRLEDAQSTRARCEVATALFESAPVGGLEVELLLRGDHAVPSALRLTFYPRAILAQESGPEFYYKETPGLELGLRSSLPLPGDLDPRLACHLQPGPDALHDGPVALNSSYYTSAPAVVAPDRVRCPLPTVWDSALDHLWLSLRLSRGADGPPLVLSSSLRLWLRPRPRIQYLSPQALPAGAPTTAHRVRLEGQEALDPDLHALRVGDADHLTRLDRDPDGVLSCLAPVRAPGFQRLVIHSLAGWPASAQQGQEGLSWATSLALEYLELPQAHSVMPSHLRAGALLPGVSRHLVVVAGRNFTSQTACWIAGAAAPTRWLASNLLECEVAAPGAAGEQRSVQLQERGLYRSRDPSLSLTFTAESFVYRLDPPQVLIQRVPALVKVHVADPGLPDEGLARSGYHCKFGTRLIRAQAVGPVRALTADEVASLSGLPGPLPSTGQELQCRSPLVSEPGVVQVEVLTPLGPTYSAGSPQSQLTFAARPSVSSFSPAVAPFLPDGSQLSLRIEGTGFASTLAYTCNFTRPASLDESWVTLATRVSDVVLACPLPAASAALRSKLRARGPFFLDVTLRADWPTVASGETSGSESTSGVGDGRLLLYQPPAIASLWPDHGSAQGGTPVYVRGEGFELGLASEMQCRFAGSLVVPARVISLSSMLLCEAPPHLVTQAEAVTVEVSVDALEFFGAEAGSPTFTYTPPPVFDPAFPSISPHRIGIDVPQTLVVRGAGFPGAALLAPGYPLCRFSFAEPQVERVTHGAALDASTVTCPSPRGTSDPSVELALSFNGHEYYAALTSAALQYLERPAVMATDPTFGSPAAAHDLALVGQRLEDVTLVGYGGAPEPTSEREELSVTSVPAFDEVVVPGTTYGNVSTRGERRLYGEPAVPVEVAEGHPTGYSTDRLVYQYVDSPRLTGARPEIVHPDVAAPILVLGRGFRATPALACRFGSHWGPSARVVNETAVECRPPQLDVAHGETIPLTVTLNGLEPVAEAEGGAAPLALVAVGTPLPVAVVPTTVLLGEVDIVVDVIATALWDSEWLACRVAGSLGLRGTLHENPDTGEQFVRCIIPSTQFLRAVTGAAPGEQGHVQVEIANDGQTFSTRGLEVLLARADQLRGIAPSNGPARGGTVLDLSLVDLAPVNDEVPEVVCAFPGPVLAPATYVSRTLVRCTSPPLAELGEGVWDASTWTWAPVGVQLGERSLGSFLFAYTRGVAVTRFEPPDTVPPEGPDAGDLTVAVHGTAFLPARDAGLRCRFQAAPLEVVVVGTYTRNGTLSCTVPLAVLEAAWAARDPDAPATLLGIEVSLNGGQQYTEDGLGLVLRAAERLREPGPGGEPPAAPSFSYTEGGARLTLYYERAYAPRSPRAACVFRSTPPDGSPPREIRAPVLAVDEAASAVECYVPPAYLLGDELAESGGTVELRLTTNGRDASANSWPYLYRRAPEISELLPQWLLAEASIAASVVGEHFFEPVGGSGFRLTSLSDPSRARVVPVVYIDEQHLELAWPASAFAVGEQVRLEVSLDGGSVFSTAPAPITVYGGVVLARVRPLRLYGWQPGERAQLLYAETGTGLLDTEGLPLLRCRFGKPAHQDQPADAQLTGACGGCDPASCSCTEAQFLNRTLLSCPVPNFETLGPVEVAVTADGGASYSTPLAGRPLRIQIMGAPTATALNVTSRFETREERAFVRLEDPSWVAGSTLQVRVAGATRHAKVQAAAPPAVVVELPRGLKPGGYEVTASADGGASFRPPGAGPALRVEIVACAAGSWCSQAVETPCPRGAFCPQGGQLAPVSCPVGAFQGEEGSARCEPCAAGSFCPSRGMPEPRACPPGYLCSGVAAGSLSQLEPCPAGYYCAFGREPQPCPDGAWCPEGTATALPAAGNYSSPQPCAGGIVCGSAGSSPVSAAGGAVEAPLAPAEALAGAGRALSEVLASPGARGPSGTAECPPGYYCQGGRAAACPAGSFCGAPGLAATRPCPPGHYQAAPGQSGCQLCPPGTFCYYAGQSLPYKCKPGYTCHYEGSPSPAQPCPAGSYCPSAIAANSSTSTMQEDRHPRLCRESTYCLWGVYTPDVDPENPQAAQVCIAGTFCGEGSETPNGKGKCWEGYYCPPNSAVMLAAPPGTYAEGTGNVAPELCRRGTYQDEPRAAACKPCPKGHECPEQGMTQPAVCGKGTFSKKPGATQCAACPQGTYSDRLGLTAEESCEACEAGYLCKRSGLTSMYEAEPCQEGHLCGVRTTRTVMLNNPCPAGYYTGPGASALEDAHLCPPSRYCARGTSESKVSQAECLPGFFCPLGTAASLTVDGEFSEGIRQVPRATLIRLIDELVRRNRAWIAGFDLGAETGRLAGLRADVAREEAKEPAKKDEGKLERLVTAIRAQEWALGRYERTVAHTEERARYLKEINITVTCREDEGLPRELVDRYFQGGQNLRCPAGTVSQRGSACLGECRKPPASTRPISILDPVDRRARGVEGVHGDEEVSMRNRSDFGGPTAGRGLQEAPPDGEPEAEVDEWAARWDTLWPYTLRPLESARVTLDFRDVPPGFEYNDHYAIVVLGSSDAPFADMKPRSQEPEPWQKKYEPGSVQQTLPPYFGAGNDAGADGPAGARGGTVKRALLELRLFNFRERPVQFRVGIYLFHGLFRPYLDYLANKVSIEFYRARRQRMGTARTFGILIAQRQMSGVTMPYNAPDVGNEPLFYIDMTSTAEGVNPQPKGYDKDVFDATFWQSKQVQAVIMPWVPFFSNCEGYDTRMVLYDVFERGGRCELPPYEAIRVVSPIPASGLDPVADRCAPNAQFPEMTCRFDEPLDKPIAASARWYELAEERDLFYVTREPIDIELFKRVSPESANPQTWYARHIADGSDDLVPATFYPELWQERTDEDGNPNVPTLVEVNFFYYQKTRDVKLMSRVEVRLKEYRPFVTSAGADPVYRLRLRYEALSYFALINSFRFSMPIYALLFALVSTVLVLAVVAFWLLNLQFATFKRPPALRFSHLARVTFVPPAQGALVAAVPALVVAAAFRALQGAQLFADVAARWTDFGGEVTPAAAIEQGRGRLGLSFCIMGLVFLQHGADAIISQPSEAEVEDVLAKRREARERERRELSLDGSDAGEEGEDDEEEEREDEDATGIRRALEWKRRHFFVACLLVALFLMVKLEFSYTELFGKNVLVFLLIFTAADLVLEQLLTRLLMSEALLVSPILGAVVVTEFIMTMGADDFQRFVGAYFSQTAIVVASRTYLGPWLEKLEAAVQRYILRLAQRHQWAAAAFRSQLVRQLSYQLQLLNLAEYQRTAKKDDEDGNGSGGEDDEGDPAADEAKREVLEKNEGLEALLGSVASYAAQTAALFLVPVALIFIRLFAHETKIPQGYQIRQADLDYYLLFCTIVVVPQLVANVFLLHVLETVHGYKIYDYFTYCDYRFRVRRKKWVGDAALDRSIAHSWRSLDNMSFSSQYYYIVNLTAFGILFLYLGLTAMLRNAYNPFADPVLLIFAAALSGAVAPVRGLLRAGAGYVKLWQVAAEQAGRRVDVATLNRLDHTSNVKTLVRNIQTNPFRHKFMRVNREWLIHNIAVILGGKNYLATAGPELQYLQAIYQRAVNAEAIDLRLRQEQAQIATELAQMPYNARAQAQRRGATAHAAQVLVSDDSVSDIPAPNWQIPPGLARDHVRRLARMWLAFARQTMRLKAMVSDLVAKQLAPQCQQCRSVFRLQVIQKIGFAQVCARYRAETQGAPFSVERWRRFYLRRQVFMTLCMECAYIDNLKAAHIVEQDGDLQRLMAENALKNVGAHDQYVARKLRLPHVRAIVHRWLWLARSSLLHLAGEEAQAARRAFRAAQEREAALEALRQGLGEAPPPEEEDRASTGPSPEAASKASRPASEGSDSLTVSSVDLAGSMAS